MLFYTLLSKILVSKNYFFISIRKRELEKYVQNVNTITVTNRKNMSEKVVMSSELHRRIEVDLDVKTKTYSFSLTEATKH